MTHSPLLQDLQLPGSHVDVNMHPTKREVGFLHQDELIQAVCAAVEAQLLASDSQCALQPAARLLERVRLAVRRCLPWRAHPDAELRAGCSWERVCVPMHAPACLAQLTMGHVPATQS